MAAKISSREIKTLQILIIVIVGAVFLFSAAILVLYYKNLFEVPLIQDVPYFYKILIFTLFFIALVEYAVVYFLPKFLLTTDKLKTRLSQSVYNQKGKAIDDPVFKLLQIYRQLMIMRLAFLDGVAILGLAILFLTISDGFIRTQPQYWLLLLPLIILLIYAYLYFPTKDKIIFYIENNMLNKLKKYNQ